MQCPVCDEKLREIERYGVTVDICPACKGVWLDRGELEKVASLEEQGDQRRADGRADHDRDDRDDERRDDQSNRANWGEQKGHASTRKRSLLSDLLEGLGGE